MHVLELTVTGKNAEEIEANAAPAIEHYFGEGAEVSVTYEIEAVQTVSGTIHTFQARVQVIRE